jgi:LacI family transcriptional regulator
MSLKSLAKELGVSIATVSYALNHKGNISAELRTRVLETAKARGYELSAVAQALRGNRLKIFGLMISSVYDEMGQRFFMGADRAAQGAGYSMILSVNSPLAGSALDAEIATARRFQSLRISGVLYVPSGSSTPAEVEKVLKEANMPFVLLYRRPASDPHPSVVVDHAKGFRLALDHLLSLGHRAIGFVYSNSYRALEVDIARKVMEKRCPKLPWAKWSASVEDDEFLALLRRRPTALFASSDDVALIAAERLAAAGIRIPQDISLVGYRDTKAAGLITPRLTTIHVPTEEIGYQGGCQLLSLIEAPASNPPRHLKLPPSLIIRESTAKPIGASGL